MPDLIFKRRTVNPVVPKEETIVTPKRRVMVVTEETDWEKVILQHLNPVNRWMYGNLSRTGELFTIRSLSRVQVPQRVITQMISNKQIALGEDDYYYVVK